MFPMMFLKFSIGFFFHDVLKIPKGVLNSKYLIFLFQGKKKDYYKSFLKMSKLIQSCLFLHYELYKRVFQDSKHHEQ